MMQSYCFQGNKECFPVEKVTVNQTAMTEGNETGIRKTSCNSAESARNLVS